MSNRAVYDLDDLCADVSHMTNLIDMAIDIHIGIAISNIEPRAKIERERVSTLLLVAKDLGENIVRKFEIGEIAKFLAGDAVSVRSP